MEGGTWPLGFGLLDIGVPILGVLLLVGLVVAVVALLFGGKGKSEEEDFSTTETEEESDLF
jgi:hypothetical protein